MVHVPNTSFVLIVHQNSCILVANDNTYISQKMVGKN
jgi:hypothetical protein